MSMAQTIVGDLSAPFPRDQISWRAQTVTKDGTKALALAYIDARDVMIRLDDVVGPTNWQDRYEFHGSRTICYLSLRIDGEWIVKADGAGDSDVEAEKGAISDALKRAAVKWGIGRYLYNLESPWVPCETSEWNGKKQWKKWTADPWKHVSNANEVSPQASSAQLKKDDVWGTIGQELADAKTLTAVNTVASTWTHIAQRDCWPAQWRNQARELFNEARRPFETADNDDGANAYRQAAGGR